MKWISDTFAYMRTLFFDSFNDELPLQERFIYATSFVVISVFYSIIGGTGLLFLCYGVAVILGLV